MCFSACGNKTEELLAENSSVKVEKTPDTKEAKKAALVKQDKKKTEKKKVEKKKVEDKKSKVEETKKVISTPDKGKKIIDAKTIDDSKVDKKRPGFISWVVSLFSSSNDKSKQSTSVVGFDRKNVKGNSKGFFSSLFVKADHYLESSKDFSKYVMSMPYAPDSISSRLDTQVLVLSVPNSDIKSNSTALNENDSSNKKSKDDVIHHDVLSDQKADSHSQPAISNNDDDLFNFDELSLSDESAQKHEDQKDDKNKNKIQEGNSQSIKTESTVKELPKDKDAIDKQRAKLKKEELLKKEKAKQVKEDTNSVYSEYVRKLTYGGGVIRYDNLKTEETLSDLHRGLIAQLLDKYRGDKSYSVVYIVSKYLSGNNDEDSTKNKLYLLSYLNLVREYIFSLSKGAHIYLQEVKMSDLPANQILIVVKDISQEQFKALPKQMNIYTAPKINSRHWLNRTSQIERENVMKRNKELQQIEQDRNSLLNKKK